MTDKKSPIIGIDLGTTYSLVSVMQDGQALILPNRLGERLTPSVVSVNELGETMVGAVARARRSTHPERTVFAFKRDMGTDKVYELAGRRVTPQDLSALVLKSLKDDAEAALGVAIEEAVITVPAYFGDAQRQATRDAGTIAGLRVERIINEPTAAALAYGLHERHRELQAVVLDLGGGTFDVTVLEIIEGVVEIQASAGDARLGGEDFVELLAEHMAVRIAKEYGVEVPKTGIAWARLLEACEYAKCRLSDAEETRVVLPGLGLASQSVDVDLKLTRADAETLWTPLLQRIQRPTLRALADAGVKAADVDEVLLVGGATRTPCVIRLAAQLFGRMPLRTLQPDEAVALGAAVQAALKAGNESVDDMVVTDIAPFTLGVGTSTQVGSRNVTGVFSPIIERGTVIPTSRVNTFTTIVDGQTQVRIAVYQGEHSMCSDNVRLGEYVIEKVPPRPAGEELIDVRFTYDLNGLLEVEMTLRSAGRKDVLLLEQRPGRLSPAEIKAAQQAMQELKMHPIEALPNATALARADALYVELTGDGREVLGRAIVHFRAAIEAQDPVEIEREREKLNGLVESFKPRW